MKNVKTMIGTGLIFLAGLMACQKDEQLTKNGNSNGRNGASHIGASIPVPGSLLANGDGLEHQTFLFGDISASCIGIYSPEGKNTYFSMRSEDGTSIAGVFSGKGKGEFTQESSMTFVCHGKTYESDNQVRIRIAEYGQAGGKIRGSFSGLFRRYDVDIRNGKQQEYFLNIQDGQFEVTRQSDLPVSAE